MLVAFAAGLIFSPYLTDPKTVFVTCGFLFLLILLAVLVILTVPHEKSPAVWPFHLLIFLFIGLLYGSPFNAECPSELLSIADGSPRRLTCTLMSTPETGRENTQLTVEAEQYFASDGTIRAVKGRMLLFIQGMPAFKPVCGDRILCLCSMRAVKNFNNFGNFDLEYQMALKNVYVTGWISSPAMLCPVGHKNLFVLEFLESIRSRIRDSFKRGTSPEVAALLKAMVLGEQGDVPPSIREAFSRAGVTHVLSVSGLHMALISWPVYSGFLWLLKRSKHLMLRFNIIKIAALLTVPFIVFYSLISGASAPCLRSAIMMLMVLAGLFWGRQWDMINNVAVAMWVLLLPWPAMLYDPSFQLSFAAVLAIIIFFQPLRKWLFAKLDSPLAALRPKRWQLGIKAADLLLLTSVVTIVTAPILAYHFGRISLISILANLVVVPLTGSLALTVSLISVVLIPVSPLLSCYFLQIAGYIFQMSLIVVEFFASVPFASVSVGRPFLIEIVLFYAAALLLLKAPRLRIFKITGVVCLAGILFLESALAFQRNFSSLLKITFLDVGQGNSAFLELPGGKFMLIDGGSRSDSGFDLGERAVAPFLRAKRVDSLDLIVLTHPHPDHLGGLPYIIQNFKPGLVVTNGSVLHNDLFLKWNQLICSKNITCRKIEDGSFRLLINGVSVEIYADQGWRKDKKDASLNSGSLVLRIGYGKRHILFPGDIEAPREIQLASSGHDLRSDVLLAPHHGSRTSSSQAFLKAVSAEVVVISAGFLNPFGFPHGSVLERYADMGCRVLRTDTDGAISCETDGDYIEITRGGRRQ